MSGIREQQVEHAQPREPYTAVSHRGSGRRVEAPRYVNRWGIRGSPQPFVCKQIAGYHFFVQGQRANLERLCDRFLNEPSDGELIYRPAGNVVLFMFNHAAALSCLDLAYQHMGWSPETEMAVMVPTVAVRRAGGVEVADHLAWFTPYIFVDNPAALIWGRETHGFPKELGWFSFPPTPAVAHRFTLDAFALRRFSPHSRMSRLRLLEVERLPESDSNGPPHGSLRAAADLLAEAWPTMAHTASAIRQALATEPPVVVPGVRLAQSLLADFGRWDLPMVFLRQVYDAANGEYAAYQAIMEAMMQITSFRGAHALKGDYQLRLFPCDSHPLHEDLGIEEVQPVRLAYHVDADATLSAGKTLWEVRR